MMRTALLWLATLAAQAACRQAGHALGVQPLLR